MSELPTLAQVAAAAGVSPATASRALSGSVRVTTATRRQVYDAMSRLGYVRHRAPRGLSARRQISAVTAVICDHMPRLFGEPYYSRFLPAANAVLDEHGSRLMMATVSPNSTTVPSFSGPVMLLGARERHPLPIALAASGIQVLCIGRPPDTLRMPYVDVDNVDGGRQAAEHFLLSGRQRLTIIAGPPQMPVTRDRVAGFTRLVRDAGLPDPLIAYGDFTAASGAHAMQWLLSHAPGLDAVFACSDPMAAGALQTLRRARRAVPDQVAVIGFDDAPVAQRTGPPLTTVRQPVEELAAVATRLLLSGELRRDLVLPTELVLRGTA